MRTLLKDNVIEALVGLVVLLVAVGFVVFAYQRTNAGTAGGYTIAARFPNVTGVSAGTDVRVSGMKIGTVLASRLDAKTFDAVLDLSIDPKVRLPTDSSAAITSEGLLGGNYISLTPGGETETLKPGDEITDTMGATDLMALIGGYINQTGGAAGAAAAAPPASPPAVPPAPAQ